MKARIQELNSILEKAKKSVQSILDLRLKGIKNVTSKEFQQVRISVIEHKNKKLDVESEQTNLLTLHWWW